MKPKTKIFTVLCLLLALLVLPVFTQITYANEEPPVSTIKVSGYISPDFIYSEEVSSQIKSGFKVEIDELKVSSVTNENGYFEINNVPRTKTGYSLSISKPSYLKRVLTNVIAPSDSYVQHELKISTSESPVLVYAGDMVMDGKQDDAINIIDIMAFIPAYNTTAKDEKYNIDLDLNKDKKINIDDVNISINHFNTYSGSYPDDVTPLPGILYLNTVNNYTVEVVFSRSIGLLDKDKFSIDGLTIESACLKEDTDNVIDLYTTPQIPGGKYNLIFNGKSYEFTGASNQNTILKAIKVDGLSVQYVENNHGKVKVSWEALTDMQINATQATGYKIIYYSDNDKNNPITVPIADIRDNCIIISGLNVKKTYKFAICTHNQFEDSLLSEYVTVTDSIPSSTSRAILASSLNNSEVAVAFDNDISKYSIDDFSINPEIKINNIRLMDDDKKILILSTSSQIPGYTYTILYKNKSSFTFTGTDLDASSMKPEPLNKKVIKVSFGTKIKASDSEGNKFTVKDQNGTILDVLSAKLDESDKFGCTIFITLKSDIKKDCLYSLKYGNKTADFSLKTEDTVKPLVTNVIANNNNEVIIKFSEPIDISGSKFELSETYGYKSPLPVTNVRYGNRNTVILTVENMTGPNLYTANISNVVDWVGNIIVPYTTHFAGISSKVDTLTFDDPDMMSIIKVQAIAPDKTIVEFSKKLDPATVVSSSFKVSFAYGSQEHLYISSARMAKKGDIGFDDIEITSDEAANRCVILSVDGYVSHELFTLKAYNVTSTDGSSLSSNNHYTFYSLVGKLPSIKQINEIGILSKTEIVVSFDQNVGSKATDITHYTISNGIGHPLKAELWNKPNQVKLTIPEIMLDTVYILTVKYLENSDGVLSATLSHLFAIHSLPRLTSVIPVDNQTLKIYFDRYIECSDIDGPIWNSSANSLVDNALFYSINDGTAIDLEDADEYAYQDPSEPNVLIVRIDTNDAFKSGILKLIGNPSVFGNEYNQLIFATAANEPQEIIVDSVVAINSSTIRVTFNQPVYGSLDTFADVNTAKTAAYGAADSISLSNHSAVDNTYKVYDFKLSKSLSARTYFLIINSTEVDAPNTIIKDTPKAGNGYVGMADEDKSTPGFQQFRPFAGKATISDPSDSFAKE